MAKAVKLADMEEEFVGNRLLLGCQNINTKK